jgi:serine/threonine protein kinase
MGGRAGRLTINNGGFWPGQSGTPEYVAPEVVARPPVGYGPGCDIWSV